MGKAPQDEVPLNPQVWTSGQVRLDSTARSVRPGSHDPRLTYGDWHTAIEAIQGFVEHYQGVDFLYNVYGADDYYSLALGALMKLRPPPKESS